MSRIRQVKPGFFKDADLYDAEVSCGLPLRIAFEGLWTVADKRGVFAWSRNIKPDILPYDPCDMLAVLDALAAAGFILRYEVGGKSYGLIPNFATHQHFHKDEKESKLPGPPENLASTVPAPGKQDADTAVAGPVIGERGTGNGERVTLPAPRKAAAGSDDPDFCAALAVYPKRAGGDSRAAAYKAWRARRAVGVLGADMLDGATRYAAYCAATGKTGTEFVKQAATFFGPDDWWALLWDVPPPSAAKHGTSSTAEKMSASMSRLFPSQEP